MPKNKTQKNIPRGWQNSLFKNCKIAIVDGDRGKNYPKQDDFLSDGFCLFLNAGNVTKNGFNFDEKQFISRSKNELMGKGKLKRKDIIITTRGTIGNISYYDDKIKFDNIRINSGMAIIRNENKSVDSKFLVKYLKSSNFKKEIKRVSFGSAQPQLTIQIINKFKFISPPFPEQNAIVKVLETWDKYLEKLSRKIEIKKDIKKGLMQRLLSGDVRLSGFSGEWKKIQIGKLLNYEQPTNYIVDSTEYDNKNKIPVLTAGKTFVLGYTNEENGIFKKEKLPVIIFDDFTTANKFVNFPFKVKSSAMKILKNKNDGISNINFIFESIQLLKFKVGEHKRNYLSEYQYLDINFPNFKEQTAIAKILTTADKEIEALEKKKKIVEEQKKFLLNNLVTGKIRVPEKIKMI